jgi:AraC-like DNA-binding protein
LHLPLIGLKPGTYHIEVMASTVPGTFVGKPYEWIINVNQPWWRTTGIMLFIALLVLAVAIANFVVYNRNMKLKMRRNSEEGDVIRRIRAFVDRCDKYSSEQLAPTQEEIFGTEKETSKDLNEDFVELIQKLLPYVHERRGRLLTMHMLSQVAEMDVLGLYELIVGNVHKSPRPLVLSMRIEQAAKLLRTTDKSLGEITEECRFVSPNYLISQFFHKYRMTPSAYRETAE